MASVTLNNVWKIYGKSIVAVRDVSLVCKDGEFTALLGPSGCGKTSTLRMIAGLEEITAGTISIGDRVVNGLRPKERDIAMVFETYGLYPHLTVYDNIAFPLRVRKLAEDDVKQRVEKSASVVDLQGILDQYPAALGDGQKQRVSIARAIVREPAVFLFDEPISHLDETLRRRMRTEIKHLQAVLGRTMVYVTHDQIEAMAMADTIVVMDLGVIKQIGTPKQLYNEPANLFVASFIGEPPMNILSGKLQHENGVLEFQTNGFRLPITEPAHCQKLEAYGKQDVIMGVRPRHIDPYYEPTARSVPSPLFGLEPHGEFNILSFKIGNEVVLVQSGPGFFPHDGQTIHLEFTNNLHFFDVSTGTSILHGEGGNGNG